MTRNLDERVEVACPIYAQQHKKPYRFVWLQFETRPKRIIDQSKPMLCRARASQKDPLSGSDLRIDRTERKTRETRKMSEQSIFQPAMKHR